MRVERVIWTAEALNDLDEIYSFLAEKSIEAANKIVFNILERVKQLDHFPESGQNQETMGNKEYRYLVEGNYKIIYRKENTLIFISTVFDTRQDPEKLK